MRIIHRILGIFQNFRKKGDWVLLFLCLLANCFGLVIVASTTSHFGSPRYLVVQVAATLLGVLCYILLTSLRMQILGERRELLFFLSAFLLLLLIPFGIDGGTGNKSWLDLPLLPVNIQPAEICKILFTILLAKVMEVNRNRISTPRSVLTMGFHLIFIVGLNLVLSSDMGVSLIFIFVFLVMAFVGGVKPWWFLGGFAGVAAAAPYAWEHVMPKYQKERFMVIFDPTIDPQGTGPRWHMKRSLMSLTGGGLSGQGLFQGNRTQVGALNAQHTDFIFSAIGEELGLIGCVFTMILLGAIVFRILYVGLKTPDYFSRMICTGIAAAMIFQICVNVGMCLGVVPVIGLTLPFISYGGSSIVSMYLAMGVVSSIHANPEGDRLGRYISPRY